MSSPHDSTDPMRALEQAGVTYQARETSDSTSFKTGSGAHVGGAGSVGMHYEWTLPSPSSLNVNFSPESFKTRLIKIFKKELQMRDSVFDNIVYITTDDKDRTARFLSAESCRTIIANVVVDGGVITIEKEHVVFEVPGAATAAQLGRMAELALAVLRG